MPVPLVVDTDIGSDVDDAIALALAARHPDLDLRAVTTVSSAPDVRAGMVSRLLELAGAHDVPVAVGRSAPGDERNAIGREHLELLPAPPRPAAAVDAIDVLTRFPPATAIATIGQQTNLAAALAHDPRLARRTSVLTVMGGSFAPFRTADGQVHGAERDWNLVLDPPGAVAALSAPWTLRYVPIDVTFGAVLPRTRVERLAREGDELCRVLAELVERWRARALPPEAEHVGALLHDPLTIACVVECAFVRTERLRVTVMTDSAGIAHTVVDPESGHDVDVVRGVDAPAFADWLVEVLLSS